MVAGMYTELLDSTLTVGSERAVIKLADQNELTPYDAVITLGYASLLKSEPPAASTTGETYVFPDGEHAFAAFEAAVETIRSRIQQGDHVFVHCQAGASRSPTVSAAVIGAEQNQAPDEALQYVAERHPKTNPSDAMRQSLRTYLTQ